MLRDAGTNDKEMGSPPVLLGWIRIILNHKVRPASSSRRWLMREDLGPSDVAPSLHPRLNTLSAVTRGPMISPYFHVHTP